VSISLPLDPRKLPGPKPAICTAKSRPLGHLVGAGDERWRHVEAERLGNQTTAEPSEFWSYIFSAHANDHVWGYPLATVGRGSDLPHPSEKRTTTHPTDPVFRAWRPSPGPDDEK
jgi:hypothetical protein